MYTAGTRIRKRYIALAVFGAVFLFILFVLAKSILSAQKFMRQTGFTPEAVTALIFDKGAILKKTLDRTNILVLGIPGGEHEGADLTDTILIVSFHHTNGSVSLLSLPRDIWSNTLKDKINSAYHYGEDKKPGGGMTLARAIVEDVWGLPIHYSLVIDFSGFVRFVDAIGGVDVLVSQAFTDIEYPIAGKENDVCEGDVTYRCRYETVHFDAGITHMDGVKALMYVRSRHAQGSEGSDFARGRRQQEVVVALKEKLKNKDLWFPPSRAAALFKTLDTLAQTDMNISEMVTLGKLFYGLKEGQTQHVSIEGLLYAPPNNWYGRYVLIPKESFDEIHASIASQLK